ncbi:hypothetical protein AX16_000359 [Volvariella volvacea WC 439]|nr:hypothetical protein AX16_000359 [Volvariella volvacea WC 439]
MDLWPPSSSSQPSQSNPDSGRDKPKKPRHRHSPSQLAALNELYEKTEHPNLEMRSKLAQRLGMEIKTVNAWFQNKRASSKKRTRAAPEPVSSLSNISANSASTSNANTPQHAELDEFQDDEYLDFHHQHQHPQSGHTHNTHPSIPSYNDHSQFRSESDSMPRRMRMRPSPEQAEELKKLYNLNPHPTTDQRQALSERIGMRYQSITNWFQNQRSLAKRRREDDSIDSIAFPSSTKLDYQNEARTYSAFPPTSANQLLSVPYHHYPKSRRSPSVSPSMDEPTLRVYHARRSTTPYSSMNPRPRRSRPEPYQLDALKDLYTKTPTPSIEERSALALEIGMDLGKVTNWFRNLRQTARKRAKKSGELGTHPGDAGGSISGDEDEDGFRLQHLHSAYPSRVGTPSFSSASSSINGDGHPHRQEMMDIEDYDRAHSDLGSDDEYQEAITPPPHNASAASPSSSNTVGSMSVLPPPSLAYLTSLGLDEASYAELERTSATRFKGVKLEDALLLLSFHQHVTQ